MAVKRTAEEIVGLEFDWFGSDLDGSVALFTTAGAGYAPEPFLLDTDAHDDALRSLLDYRSTTDARFFPQLDAGLVNTWRLVAERGLYAYDCNPNGGPYRLVAAPSIPARAEHLPSLVTELAARVRCFAHFNQQ